MLIKMGSLNNVTQKTLGITMMVFVVSSVLLQVFISVQCSKILVYIPTPSISHQVPVRIYTNELVRRGHNVVLITTDPGHENGKAPENLTEIDLHDISYKAWMDNFMSKGTGSNNDLHNQQQVMTATMLDIIVKQMKTPAVQKIMFNETFDLIITEAWMRPTLLLTHLHKTPAIQLSTFSGYFSNFEMMGTTAHPILYPLPVRQKINNLAMWEKFWQLYDYYVMFYHYVKFEKIENEVLRHNFAPDMPDLSELYKNVDMMFLNVYPTWDTNRPISPNIVYIGGIHQVDLNTLPQVSILLIKKFTILHNVAKYLIISSYDERSITKKTLNAFSNTLHNVS